MLEDTLEDFIKAEGLSPSKFYASLSKVEKEGSRRDLILLKMIQAQEDYKAFVEQMRQEAKRRHSEEEKDNGGASSKTASAAPKVRAK